ncbi:hypothetical protein M9M43_002156 [Escherichia coli]|nr:hypothetical protein [Escherichia coli]EFG6327254.1 hypothetical protein [Escherichia coli]EFG9812119.1 hypothetical protein [Escherichia coli]EGM5719001.1 hypothetical protein [Escherichia coli]EGN3042405.1 hypothetical protein [Escherichia coli]
MLKTPVFFSATLTRRLDKADRALPLAVQDEDRLAAILEEDDHTWLTIRDDVGAEVVRITHTCGGFVVDRGEDGTTPLNFPKGSCVRWEMTPAVVKDLICTHNCCDDECPCDAVTAAGIALPEATKGVQWHGSAIFTGSTPMELAVAGAPAWVKVQKGANYVTFSGVPAAPGEYTLSVAATNCDGKTAVQQGKLIVK